MYITAVKFGRMSKKQREKVEDEVRFHRAQLRAQNDSAPDSSVFEQQTPSSSDQLHHSYNGGWVDRWTGKAPGIVRFRINFTYLGTHITAMLVLTRRHIIQTQHKFNKTRWAMIYPLILLTVPQRTIHGRDLMH